MNVLDDETALFEVVRNDEAQFSIWPSQLAIPQGWTPTGFAGLRQACLDHLQQEWTDLRPQTLRKAQG